MEVNGKIVIARRPCPQLSQDTKRGLWIIKFMLFCFFCYQFSNECRLHDLHLTPSLWLKVLLCVCPSKSRTRNNSNWSEIGNNIIGDSIYLVFSFNHVMKQLKSKGVLNSERSLDFELSAVHCSRIVQPV